MSVTYHEMGEDFVFRSEPVTVTEAHVIVFGGLIGNFHPSHFNEEYAKTVGPFQRRVIHGELTHSLSISGFAQLLRDTSLGQLGASYRLTAPVYIGDTVYTEIRLHEKRMTSQPNRGFVRFSLRMLQQDGKCVSEGTADFLVSTVRLPLYPRAT
ncbi:MAG: hypothetical protein HY649_06235 [Acidobacteria bacterium]|nr:hypothetical protein [Acidobacteriota bacterium]